MRVHRGHTGIRANDRPRTPSGSTRQNRPDKFVCLPSQLRTLDAATAVHRDHLLLARPSFSFLPPRRFRIDTTLRRPCCTMSFNPLTIDCNNETIYTRT